MRRWSFRVCENDFWRNAKTKFFILTPVAVYQFTYEGKQKMFVTLTLSHTPTNTTLRKSAQNNISAIISSCKFLHKCINIFKLSMFGTDPDRNGALEETPRSWTDSCRWLSHLGVRASRTLCDPAQTQVWSESSVVEHNLYFARLAIVGQTNGQNLQG
jgi:hypothetical protein